MVVSATLKAKGIHEQLITPKHADTLTQKGIGKRSSQLLHPCPQLQSTSSSSAQCTPIQDSSITVAAKPKYDPCRKSHQQLIQADAMRRHSLEGHPPTEEHEFSDLPGLIGDDGISFPHWSRDEDKQESKAANNKKDKSQIARSDSSTLAVIPKGKRKEAPPLHYSTRGSKKAALDVAADDALMATALGTYITE